MRIFANSNVKIIKKENRRNILRLLGIVGIMGAFSLLAMLISMHFLRPEFNYITEYTSDYANGPYGFLFVFSLLVHSVGNGAIAVGFWYMLNDYRSGRVGTVLFGLAAVGIALAGIFFTDPTGLPRTIFGTIHTATAIIAFLVEIMALFFLRRAFSSSPYWKSFGDITGIIAVISAAGFLILLALINLRILPGLVERVSGTPLFIWELLAGFRLARYSE